MVCENIIEAVVSILICSNQAANHPDSTLVESIWDVPAEDETAVVLQEKSMLYSKVLCTDVVKEHCMQNCTKLPDEVPDLQCHATFPSLPSAPRPTASQPATTTRPSASQPVTTTRPSTSQPATTRRPSAPRPTTSQPVTTTRPTASQLNMQPPQHGLKFH